MTSNTANTNNNAGEEIMRTSRRTMRRSVLRKQPVAKPTVFTLLTHIMASTFTGGMFLILVFGSALVTLLYYNNFAPDNLLVLLLGIIIVMAFYRGCQAWQQDLNNYRRHMSAIRPTHESET